MSHRSGKLKQDNKKFRGTSKRSLKNKGKKLNYRPKERMGLKSQSIIKKNSRRNNMRQKREKQRMESLQKQRIGSNYGPPKLIGILSLSKTSPTCFSTEDFRNHLLQSMSIPPNNLLMQTFTVPSFKTRLTFLKIERDHEAVLDAAKVSDLLLLLIDCKDGIDQTGFEFLNLLRAQGLPSHILVIQGTDIMTKRKKTIKKKFFEILKKEFPGSPKIIHYNNPQNDCIPILRGLIETSVKDISYRENRNYMLVESCDFHPYADTQNTNDQNHNPINGEELYGDLEIRGYLRGGRPFNPNQLLHIVHYGTFQMKKMGVLPDPYPLKEHEQKDQTVRIYHPTPLKQESLQSQLNPDPLLSDPTFSQTKDEEFNIGAPPSSSSFVQNNEVMREMNQQMSNISAVVVGAEGEQRKEEEYGEDEEEDDMLIPEENDGGFQFSIDATPNHNEGDDVDDDGNDEEEIYEDKMEFEESKKLHEKMIQHLQHKLSMKNSDYVVTPDDVPARKRFTKYRGLKDGFRKTFWDPYENLPFDYGKIYQFHNFEKTRKTVMKDYWSSSDSFKVEQNSAFLDMLEEKKKKREDKKKRKKMEKRKGESENMLDEDDELYNIDFNESLQGPTSMDDDDFLSNEQKTMNGNENEKENNANNSQQQQQQGRGDYKVMLSNEDTFVPSENYVSILIKNVPSRIKQIHQPGKKMMIVFALLKHENRMSVTHFCISRNQHISTIPRSIQQMNYNTLFKKKNFKRKKKESKTASDFDDDEGDMSDESSGDVGVLRSKEEMFVQIGFRRYKCNPIFSEHSLSNDSSETGKFKFLKAAFTDENDPNKFVVGSIYSHVTFRPCPVLVFKKVNGKIIFVANGNLMNVDPLRIILKKITLTGHIYRSHKRKCYVRFMFFNPEDIEYFKPVGVYTTAGLRGVITQSVGKHGYMKCFFQQNVQQNQLVLMDLYKRVFPKWSTECVSLLK